ncbi:MAG: branched-chain amino acid ABC transporter permease [Oscillospiraceae bacterium]|nr:branched-chain amino acid ABC transporter permease [Oscillospiraceae bacterium]
MTNTKIPVKSYILNTLCIALLYAVMMAGVDGKFITRYAQGIIITVCINIILAVSLNIATGFLGEIALGHAGFMSVGAYTAALFTKHMEITTKTPNAWVYLLVALALGGLVAAAFGMLVGIPALRLKGDYLAIITLGFGEIIRVLIEYVPFTGGAQGLKSIPKIAKLPVVFWVTIAVVVILFTFVRSRQGRVITAIREDDIASEAVGINNTYYKVMAFVVSAFFAGVAGGLYAHYVGILGAKTFDFNKSIDILVIVVLGGMGSLTGSIIAAIGLTVLPEALRGFAEYRMLIYSVALIIVMLFKPSGLFGKYEFSLSRALSNIFKKGKAGNQPKGTKGGSAA